MATTSRPPSLPLRRTLPVLLALALAPPLEAQFRVEEATIAGVHAAEARKRFDAVKAEARGLGIPILTRTQFLHFIGYGVPRNAKDDERPIRPGEATGVALQRHLLGVTPALRAERMQRFRRATPAEVKRALLAVLETEFGRGAICVVASREKLEQANARLGSGALVIEEILKR